MRKSKPLLALPTCWEDAVHTKQRKFQSDLPCLHGHGTVRMAYRNGAKKHAPCAECHRLHSAGERFGLLPKVLTAAERRRRQD
jgi:hypothetical protein